MATQEKQKQKKGFMNFYKSSTKNYMPKSEPIVVTSKPTPVTFLSKKSKKFQENVHSTAARRETKGEEGGNLVEAARKSVSHVETNLSSVAAFLQVKVLVSDMPGFMQAHAFRCARRSYDSLEKFSSKHMAYNMKKVCWKCVCISFLYFGLIEIHN